jgi:serine phosphatase RsbU (regulator of sigma subunit)/pSer/pThr/pTyr-binding forkhead associated (FHA) protein
MATLITVQGPESGRQFSLAAGPTILGRQMDCTICLDAKAVSRQHAQILLEDGAYFVEDMGSSNGTFVNGSRITGRVPLTENDTLQIGPYLFTLRLPPPPENQEDMIIKEQVSAVLSNVTLFRQDPGQKLQVILEISQNLSRTLELEPLLDKLLDQLFGLFRQADRGIVLLCDGKNLIVRAQKSRRNEDVTTYGYSRTIVKHVLDQGVGVLSDDIRADSRFQSSATIASLNVRSLLCVPLIAADGRRLGVIQIDRTRTGMPFRVDDLQLLTTVALQVSVVLENASLHAELLREARFRQELAMARDIQQSFLPTKLLGFKNAPFEMFAQVHPAREVSGDLYDYFRLHDGRVGFFVGDVSGKGMPSALFMIAVRTLIRHVTPAMTSPSETLTRLNDALSADNPSSLFVTVGHGMYTPATGEVVVASGGHPTPLVRRADGTIEDVAVPLGRLIGYEGGNIKVADHKVTLGQGDLLVYYTDGFTEAREPSAKEMYELDRFKDLVRQFQPETPLRECVGAAKDAIEKFIKSQDLQDDLTLLLLRRKAAGPTERTKDTTLPEFRI